MNEERISLSPSEWRVMEVLWRRDATVMELVRTLGQSAGWAKSTVTTMVRRMEAKELIIHRENEKGAKVFRAAVAREQAAAAETDSLLSRVYRGSVGLMVNAMVERGSLSSADIAELYAILDRAEQKQQEK